MDGYFHAAPSSLEKIDDVHYSFLRYFGMEPNEAFLENALAPLNLRRNIDILSLLHKRVLGKCHLSFGCLLP